MNKNKILITINKPIAEVFQFTINPQNTPKWIDSIEREEANEYPVKVGTVYKNVDTSGKWTEYILVKLEENKLFELVSKNEGYHVRYTFAPKTADSFELEYFEWVEDGELPSPFSLDVLKKLKDMVESNNERN